MKANTFLSFAAITLALGLIAPLAAQQPAILPDRSTPEFPPGVIARLGISRLPMGGPRAFAKDGKSFVGISGNGLIIWFDARTGQKIDEKIPVPDGAQHPKFSADGTLLVLMINQREIQVTETSTGRLVFRQPVPDLCFGADFTVDGSTIVAPNKKGNDLRLLAWDIATGTERVLIEKGADLQ